MRKPTLPIGRQSTGLLVNGINIVGQGQRHNIGSQTVNHRPALFARTTVGLADNHGFTGLRFPVAGKGSIIFLKELAGRIVGGIQESYFSMRHCRGSNDESKYQKHQYFSDQVLMHSFTFFVFGRAVPTARQKQDQPMIDIYY
jgi:hypothetical protein